MQRLKPTPAAAAFFDTMAQFWPEGLSAVPSWVIGFAFLDDQQAHEQHQALHGVLVGELGCRVEFNGVHYGASTSLQTPALTR